MTAAAVAANLGGVALFAFPGLGLTQLLPPLARLPLPRRLGYAYLLGVTAVAGSLFAASHLFGVPLRRPAIAAACLVPVAAGVAAVARRRRHRGREREHGGQLASGAPGGHDWGGPADRRGPAGRSAPAGRRGHGGWRGWSAWRRAVALAMAAACLGPLAMALSLPLGDWDGRMTWSAQAAYMRHEGTVDTRVLTDGHWFIVHPHYPPLLPLSQVAVQELFGAGQDDQFFRAFYVGFLASLLLLIVDGAGRAAGTAAAALAALCAAAVPFLGWGMGGAVTADSDLPLAALYGAALVMLLSVPRREPSGLAAGILLAGVVLAKNEGQLLAMVALLLASLRLVHRGPPRRLATHRLRWFAAAVLPPLVAMALLTAWRAGIPERFSEDYFGGLGVSALVRGAASRLPRILPDVASESFRWSDWMGFWLLFPAVLLAGRQALRRPLARRLLLAGAAPCALGLAAYAVTRDDLRVLIAGTWPRFLLQGMVPLAVVFACALAPLLRRLRRPQPAPLPAAGTPAHPQVPGSP